MTNSKSLKDMNKNHSLNLNNESLTLNNENIIQQNKIFNNTFKMVRDQV